MGIFGNSSPFDQDIEKVTSENNTSEDWGAILEICDRAGASPAAARDCLRAAMRRLAHPDPHVQVQAATLLDACVANCGRAFHLEVASRDFEHELRRVLSRAQPAVATRLRQLLRKWAEGEFRDDPQLDLIVSLHRQLRAEAAESPAQSTTPAPSTTSAGPLAPAEDEELARAIALSLREAGSAPALYPRVDADTQNTAPVAASAALAPAPRKVRALYDFEAAEDNELTFLAGEIVVVTDCSDPNWWKGQNARGEGLFPANFVTSELSEPMPIADVAPAAASRAYEGTPGSGEEEGEGVSAVDERALDEALALLLEADPECAEGGAAEEALRALEARAARTGARVDAALERADRTHARLTHLSAELVHALNLYHDLMRDPLKPLYGMQPPAPPGPHAPHAHYPPQHHMPPRC